MLENNTKQNKTAYKLEYNEWSSLYSNVGEEFAPLLFSNVAGLSTRVAEQLIPTWAKFNGKTTIGSLAR